VAADADRETDRRADLRHAGLGRRFASILYDALLLGSVLFMATFPALVFTGGEPVAPGNPLYLGWLLLIAYFYFAWPWTHGGQTLGMKSWGVRVCTAGGGALGWRQASARFCLAALSWGLLGGGFLAALGNAERIALHDRWSGTVLIRTQ
jgi:uncharacterized RDD family membrane protein YckC